MSFLYGSVLGISERLKDSCERRPAVSERWPRHGRAAIFAYQQVGSRADIRIRKCAGNVKLQYGSVTFSWARRSMYASTSTSLP